MEGEETTETANASRGVLASQQIRAMVAEGAVPTTDPIVGSQVQPASLDLRLGVRAWRVRAGFLPGPNLTVADRLADFAMHEMDLTNGAALERDCVYVIELQERLALPADVSAIANAKSTTGRLDLFTRLVTDRTAAFDRVAAGYAGPLYVQVSPGAFSVLVRPGNRLNQIRFARGRDVLTREELTDLHEQDPLASGENPISGGPGFGGLKFSVDLDPQSVRETTARFRSLFSNNATSGLVGWRARRNAPLIDLSMIDHYPVSDFWEPVFPHPRRSVILDPGAFYILVSREAVSIPPQTAAEMVPYMAVAGEFRVHYAGFFDPGFGHASTGGAGSRSVLEVRCHEAPYALQHGQMVGRLIYEWMAEEPEILYGRGIGSNYQGQALKLAKHFRGGG